MIKLVNRGRMNPARRRVKVMAPKAAKTATSLQKTVKSRRLVEEAGGNGKKMATSEERTTIGEQCGKAPAAMAGGQRRSFPGPPKPGSLVRLIKRRCNASIHCDIIGEEGIKKTSMDVLCDTGTQAGCCGVEFVKKNGYTIDEDCNTKLIDASGNQMEVVGSVEVWIRPSEVIEEIEGGEPIRHSNEGGEAYPYELVVTEQLGDEIYLGRDDCVRMGVIDKNFPSKKSTHSPKQVRKIQATVTNSKMAALAEKLARLKREYKEVFGEISKDQAITIGEPMKIHLNESDEKPYRAYTARRPPRALQEKADKLMDNLERSGVVSRVYWPTEWCSPGMFTPKPHSDKVRLVTDYTQLNKRIRRSVRGSATAKQIRERIKPTSRWFAACDLNNGYFQIPLDEHSKDITTFMVSQNDAAVRYRYNRAPQGLAASGDEFCARTDEAFHGVQTLQKLVDDVIVEDETMEGVLDKVEEIFKRCREHSILLSEEKIQIGQKIKFGGFIIDATSGEVEITPDPELLADIRNFPVPQNLRQLRSFQGLANQITSWNPDVAQHLMGMRLLTKKDTVFNWTDEMQEEFEKARQIMSDTRILKPFDENLKTVLVTDASRSEGVGFLLMQRRENEVDKFNIIQAGSYAYTDTQKRYSASELEMLGVYIACKKCYYYLQGLQSFELLTDHSALVDIFKKDIVDITNPRLRAFREKLMDMSIKADYLPGKKNLAADALSRVPMWRKADVEDPSANIFSVRRTLYRKWPGVKVRTIKKSREKEEGVKTRKSIPPKLNYAREDIQLQKMFVAVKNDENYRAAMEKLREGATKQEIVKLGKGHPARVYKEVWDELTLVDDEPDTIMIMGNLRLVVPEECRKRILRALHIPHAGVKKTLEMAKERYFWPRMRTEIEELVGSCETCTKRHPSKPNNPMSESTWTAKELEPMSAVSADHFSIGNRKYLIVVDRYSSFPFVVKVVRMTTQETIQKLEDIFNTMGWPRSLRSDGGPAFRIEFGDWCKSKGIKWELSSSYYARSNGSAEVRVGNCKKVMVKSMETNEDVEKALSQFRNMPAHDGFTPSSMFFKRILRSPDLPALRREYTEESRLRDEENRGSCHRRRLEKLNEEKGERKPRKQIKVGTECWVQDGRPEPAGTKLWDKKSTVTEIRDSGSYKLVDKEGTVSIRNGKTLKPVFVKRAPKIKEITDKKEAKEKKDKSWAEVVKNTPNNVMLEELAKVKEPKQLEKELAEQLNSAKKKSKPGVVVDISRDTLLWNNAVESAAKRLKERKKKKVTFREDSKGEDGGNKVRRRSERLKKRTPSAEKFVRKLRPSTEMTWGPYRFIISSEGEGDWYEEEMEPERAVYRANGKPAG